VARELDNAGATAIGATAMVSAANETYAHEIAAIADDATTFDSTEPAKSPGHRCLKVKGSVYVALCLSILLYGSEMWCLREVLFDCLRYFHHRCARTMCRITITNKICHRISSASLLERLSVEPFDTR
jgi:hypothetical protein